MSSKKRKNANYVYNMVKYILMFLKTKGKHSKRFLMIKF